MSLLDSVASMGLSGANSVVGSIMPMVQRSGETPARVVGRLAGLGDAELKAGVPKWAWLGVGVVAGATVMWIWGAQIKSKLGK